VTDFGLPRLYISLPYPVYSHLTTRTLGRPPKRGKRPLWQDCGADDFGSNAVFWELRKESPQVEQNLGFIAYEEA
jgi:hypothetical protein